MDTIIYPLAAAGRAPVGARARVGDGARDARLGIRLDGRPDPRRCDRGLRRRSRRLRDDDPVLRADRALAAPHRQARRDLAGARRPRAAVRRRRSRRAAQRVRPDRIRLRHRRGGGHALRVPRAVADVARRLFEPNATVLDAGAGTGLLGVELARAGFRRLDALDMSNGMLEQAAAKGVYRDLRLGAAGRRARLRDGFVRRGSSARVSSPQGMRPPRAWTSSFG
jgi:hypothetical protein